MLYIVNNAAQALVLDNNVNFGTNIVSTGCVATHSGGSTAIQLNKSGYYKVTGNILLSGTAAGVATMTLNVNGVAYPGAIASHTITTAGDVVTLPIEAIVHVLPNCPCNNSTPATITLTNTGVDVTISNIAVSVSKIA